MNSIALKALNAYEKKRVIREAMIASKIDQFCALVDEGWGISISAKRLGFDWSLNRHFLMQFPRVQRVYDIHMTRTRNRVNSGGMFK